MCRAIIGCGVTCLVLSAGTLAGGHALLGSYVRSVKGGPEAFTRFPAESGRYSRTVARTEGEDTGPKAAGIAAGEALRRKAAKKHDEPVADGHDDGESWWRPVAPHQECSPFLRTHRIPCRDTAR